MKAFELIKALEEGRVIGINHAKTSIYSEYSEEEKNSFDFTEFLYQEFYSTAELKHLVRKGWGSGIGNTDTILHKIFIEPNNWKVYFNSKEDFQLYWKNKYCTKPI